MLQVGPKVLFGWFGHFAMLVVYTFGYNLLKPFKRVFAGSYTFQRLLDALKYGSGSDYTCYTASAPVGGAQHRGSDAGRSAGDSSSDGSIDGSGRLAAPVGVGQGHDSAAVHGVKMNGWPAHAAVATVGTAAGDGDHHQPLAVPGA